MRLERRQRTASQRGAVALFVVIFTSILVTTITISFVQLMVKDQQQAMYSDLSESAYDSAVAGVEDAKRALLMQQDCIGDTSPTCNNVRGAIEAGECSTLSRIFEGGLSDETLIVQEEGDRALAQAYTCVKITQDTEDYIGSIDSNMSATLVPLRAKGEFNRIVISWGLSKNGGAVDLTNGDRNLPVAETESWPEDRPALLRAQLINGQGSFSLSDFDTTGYSNTLFMYPSQIDGGPFAFALDGRRGGASGKPELVRCDSPVSSGAYACTATIDVDPVVTADNSQTAFLNLSAFYNRTDYKIELLSNSTPVLFDGVQPEVDSTGRANDLFRRVVSRLELNNTFNYPVAALETRNNICKNFSVTTEVGGYLSECEPVDD